MAEKKSLDEKPLMKYGTLVFDMMLISVIWSFVGCLGTYMIVVGFCYEQDWVKSIWGLLLFGLIFILVAPATSAMYYTWGKRQRGRESYLTRDYFHGYKTSFGKGFLLALIFRGLIVVLAALIVIEGQSYDEFGMSGLVLIAVQLMLIIILLLADTVIVPLVARFDLPIKEYIRFGVGMGIKHLPTTFLCLLMTAIYTVAGFFFPISLILLPGVLGYFQTALFGKVFRKYMSQEDINKEDDVAPEDVLTEEETELDPERQAIIDRYKNQSKEE